MNGFLVLAGCGIDNIPIAMFDDIHTATAVAVSTTENDVKKIARELLKLDTSHIICIDIITFVDGYPVERKKVKDFDDDSDEVAVPQFTGPNLA